MRCSETTMPPRSARAPPARGDHELGSAGQLRIWTAGAEDLRSADWTPGAGGKERSRGRASARHPPPGSAVRLASSCECPWRRIPSGSARPAPPCAWPRPRRLEALSPGPGSPPVRMSNRARPSVHEARGRGGALVAGVARHHQRGVDFGGSGSSSTSHSAGRSERRRSTSVKTRTPPKRAAFLWRRVRRAARSRAACCDRGRHVNPVGDCISRRHRARRACYARPCRAR